VGDESVEPRDGVVVTFCLAEPSSLFGVVVECVRVDALRGEDQQG
jgi:hypothetical protein